MIPPMAQLACLLLHGLIFAGVVVGGGLILVGARISASPPRSLAAGPATPAGTILAVRWPNKGWSHPVLPVHGELAKRVHAAATASSFRRAEQLPPEGAAAASTAQPGFRRAAASALRRGFCAGSTARGSSLHHAARLPARSCLRRAAHGSTARSCFQVRKDPTRGAPLLTSQDLTRRSARSLRQSTRTRAPLVRPHRSRLRHGDSDPGRGRPACDRTINRPDLSASD